MDPGLSALPNTPPVSKTVLYAVLMAAALFLFLAVVLLPYPGLQNDECLFAQPYYGATAEDMKIHLFRRDVTLMLMSYLGTVKTLVFKPILKMWAPSVWSIRFPGLVTGAATIWMFGLLLYRLAGPFAAIAGAFLLALDPSYILTTVFDWGPVAIQHFCLVGGVLALNAFYRSGSRWMLAAGFGLLGLGMWDKALFSWMLSGLVVASCLFLLKEIWRRLTLLNVAIAVGAFLLGAAPLLIYNVRTDLETFRGNTKFVPNEIWPKTIQVRHTLDGSGLFGYLTHEEWDDSPRQPENGIERFSTALRHFAGYRRQGWLGYALLLALVCVPFWTTRWKIMAFASVVMVVAWLMMASVSGAGGATHHVVLLWPVPQLLVAVGLATAVANRKILWRWAAGGLVVVVCLQNTLVTNQYLYSFQLVGAGSSWTDAIFPLKDALVRLHPEHVNQMDWGAEFNILALTRGKMDIRWGAEPGDREVPNANDLRLLTYFLDSAAESVWVEHREPIEVTSGSAKRFAKRALDMGYGKQELEVIRDRNGREMFVIYRFVKVSP